MRLASIAALLLVVACEHADVRVADGQTTVDSTASVWLSRARAEPAIASWLYLRAASETADSAARAALYAKVDLPLARERIPWTEAQALETYGDTAGALKAYLRLPAPVTVLRLRAAVTPTARDSVRRELIALISSGASASSVREATGVFDTLFKRPTSSEQVAIARASARIGSWARARDGFAAVPITTLTSQDRFSFATVLSRLNADKKAAEFYASVKSPAKLALAARYQRARSLLASGDGATARSVLRALAGSGSDTSAAAALSLIADLQTDTGDDAAARITLLSLARRFPSTRFAAPAQFDAALIALILDDAKTAGREFEKLASKSPTLAIASVYWMGRAHEAAGDSAAARTAWADVLRRDSTSYYASLAATRLGVQSMHAVQAATGFPHLPQVDSAVRRVVLLNRFGMSSEARMENDRLYKDAVADTARLLATAAAFSGTDQAARAIALGRMALPRFGSTTAIWRLIFPVAARDTIVSESNKAGLDPAFVAALIRQESNFNPAARSPAGARGLMQVMPAVGKSIAPSAGITSWNANLLYDPGINIELGIRHLAPLMKNQPSRAKALAAYNAGESRVTRWSKKKGADDPEIFTERIPFTETREYVKSVLRNREFYRAPYAW
ncbi:MAG: lytic transglycosylase domain-containing protein [Gemmatimonadaceae bacterium]